ncbi:hypothetical protein PAESOLCIP111_01764 [Paenibacillus solanacearum]|uniref:Gamma-glutamylcyclotransferase AIG2-like domain-containing protein n=1 Tax=Paenibacillus solanacearum TaxID=2048548 RepID=A0A916JY43_9BACL|nr:gamma-glutamylcyclotransferase family protein [Paenibacillus solanacearum]CAG7614948.1 hypothetical protein PAESOLCIP111_01764 [Paenibacillus solanacearum]
MIPVFVYGTLLEGESNHHVVASYTLSSRPGVVYGKLYDCGDYPAIVLAGYGDGDLVEGWWLIVTEEGLARMDALEEYYGPGMPNDYERIWVRDARREEREGWIYAWADSRGCPAISGRSWRKYRESRQTVAERAPADPS